jgi:hypothetical protein
MPTHKEGFRTIKLAKSKTSSIKRPLELTKSTIKKTIKVLYKNTLRNVSLPSLATWDEFTDAVTSLFSLPPQRLVGTYTDEYGDVGFFFLKI